MPCLVCRIGRLQVNLLSRLLDMALLCSMAYVPPGTDYRREILVVLHLTRTAFANCGRPLMKSLMMDNVPSRHRGKFNALDSVRTFSWSGSAAAGGYGPASSFLPHGVSVLFRWDFGQNMQTLWTSMWTLFWSAPAARRALAVCESRHFSCFVVTVQQVAMFMC